MDEPQLESMYRRWLSEVWGQGRTDVARELMAEDLVDRQGEWAARTTLEIGDDIAERVAS